MGNMVTYNSEQTRRMREVHGALLGIRVVSLVHERLSLRHSLERALGYGASMLEFGFGFVQYFTHLNKRTVHDRIAETIVILDARKKSSKPRNIKISQKIEK